MKRNLLFMALLLALVSVYSCGDDKPDDPVITKPDPQVKITNGILTDENGKALYFFANDASATTTCTGTCRENWPVYNIDKLSISSGLLATDFGSITGADGIKQTTYKGWPLYYYKNDTGNGTASGDGQGEVWFAARPDYTVLIVASQLTGADGVKYNGQYKPGDEVVKYLVDDKGKTLYAFKNDFKNSNVFTKSDFSNNAVWPIYEVNTVGSVPSGYDKADFGTIDVFGKKQLTYKGWPVYYFGQDGGVRGLNKGVSVPSPGVWPIINKAIATPAVQPAVTVKTHATLGKVLADENGRTLYFFTRDFDGNSACAGGCLTNWPPYYIANLKADATLVAADFATITKADGTKQTTYKGWPLYYFNQDAAPADAKGEAVSNVWFVAKSDYTVMQINAQLKGNDGVDYNSMYKPGTEVTPYLVDASGRTLYGFVNDRFLKNNFTRADLTNNAVWPIFEVNAIGSIPSIYDKSLFTIMTVHGKKQLAYNGNPLYYFGQDGAKRGPNKGVSVPTPGIWPIVNKNTVEAACTTTENTYAKLIKPLMDANCATSGCHSGTNPAANANLSTYAVVKAVATSGKLMGVISHSSGFKPMPQGADKLDKCTIAAVKAWVDAGALDN
jgi:predicted lipoprotein with Yx(FWY)xxD motif